MAHGLFESSVTTAKAALLTLEHILQVAEKSPDASNLLNARLIDSMKPLTFQVYMVTSISRDLISRLMGQESARRVNDLNTYDDMRRRIAETLTALDGETNATVVNKRAGDSSFEQMGPLGHQNITNKVFALAVAMPNIQFHTAIAYAILRKSGVLLQKSDYIVGFMAEHFTSTD